MTIDYTLQVDELAALGDDPSAQAVNDNLTATMQYRGRTVGDIKVTEEDGPVLVYKAERRVRSKRPSTIRSRSSPRPDRAALSP